MFFACCHVCLRSALAVLSNAESGLSQPSCWPISWPVLSSPGSLFQFIVFMLLPFFFAPGVGTSSAMPYAPWGLQVLAYTLDFYITSFDFSAPFRYKKQHGTPPKFSRALQGTGPSLIFYSAISPFVKVVAEEMVVLNPLDFIFRVRLCRSKFALTGVPSQHLSKTKIPTKPYTKNEV